MFIADTNADRVVEVTAGGVETTLASGLHGPQDVAVDSSDNLYTTELASKDVVQVSPTGAVTTIASGLESPAAVAVGPPDKLVYGDAGTIQVEARLPDSRNLRPPGLVVRATFPVHGLPHPARRRRSAGK